jgi:outer membrane protein assembly factor BamA
MKTPTHMLVAALAVGLMLPVHTAAAEPADTTAQRQRAWTVLPILFSSPDTGFGFGVLPQYVFRTTPATRPSSIRLDVYYTQERQFNVTARAGVWLPGNRYHTGAKVQLREWPTSFYGIGNTFADSSKEAYTERSVEASAEVQRRFRPGFYAGALIELRHSAMLEREAGGALAEDAVAGSSGGQALGVGIFLTLDTRNDVFYPAHGHLIRLGSRVYGRVAGADFGFTQHRLDARRYFQLHGPHVVALQGTLRLSTGTPPFQMLPGVGEVVRGYASKRYADRHLLAFQAEYRVAPLVWRFGLVFFVGAGQVAHVLGDFAPGRFHVAYGAGLRFQILRSANVNVRWDFGFGKDSSGDYLDLNEAF